jgi:hypothetical protein
MPGRVEAIAQGPHPDTHPQFELFLCIRLYRDGKDWRLSWVTYHDGCDDPEDTHFDWQPLVDAPLKYKMAAVNIFPDLLQSIEKSQAELVSGIRNASRNYDILARTLNLPPIYGDPVIDQILAGAPVQGLLEEVVATKPVDKRQIAHPVIREGK